jgi:P2-related tail formation protein
MIQNPGADLLFSAATALERAMADVDAEAWLAIQADLIGANGDPYKVQPRNLIHLAFAKGVTFWDDAWPDSVKRAWIAQQATFKGKIGTEEALQMAFAIERSAGRPIDIVQIVTAPQDMFWASSPTPADVQAYMDLLPEIRIYHRENEGSAAGALVYDEEPDDGRGLVTGFYDDPNPGHGFYLPDQGTVLAARQPVLWRNGVETPLVTISEVDTIVNGVASYTQRAVIPGQAGAALFMDDEGEDGAASFWDDAFYDQGAQDAVVYAYQLTQPTAHVQTDFAVTVLRPSFTPYTPRFDVGTLIGSVGPALMYDEPTGAPFGFYDDELDDERRTGFYVQDNGPSLRYDRLKLYDPTIPYPRVLDGDFWDDARYGIPRQYAELLISADRTAGVAEFIYDRDFWDDTFWSETDTLLMNRALDAIVSAKALRDTIRVSFQTTRPITLGDRRKLDGSWKLGSRTARFL